MKLLTVLKRKRADNKKKKELETKLLMLQSSAWKDYVSHLEGDFSILDLAAIEVFSKSYDELSIQEQRLITMALSK